MTPTLDQTLDYPGDTWTLQAYTRFQQVNPFTAALFHGRCLFDIGANTDTRPAGDVQFYLDKHLAQMQHP